MDNESGKKPGLHKKHVARLERERQQSRMILYVFIGIIAAVVLLLGYGYLDIKYLQLQRPVAKVGETEILAKQFEAHVRLQRQQLLGQYNTFKQYEQFGMDVQSQLSQIQSQLSAPENIGQTVLDQLINDELIRQEAKKRGIVIDKAELDKMVEGAFRYYPDGSPTPSPTPTEFTLPDAPAEAFKVVTKTPIPSATPEVTATSAPEATPSPTATLEPVLDEATATPEPTATPYTQAGYETQLSDASKRLEKLGFSAEDYRSLFEVQLLQEKLQEAITADVPRTEKQVWARHILVSDVNIALLIVERLKKGVDFASLATEYSEDTGSAVNGGDLGWFSTGAMVAEFETAAFALEKSGDFTLEPVKSQFGYHIIQLIAKQDRPLTPEQYDAAKTKAFQDWLTSARETYGVEIFDLWKTHIPSDPNPITLATDAALDQLTAQAETANAPTAVP